MRGMSVERIDSITEALSMLEDVRARTLALENILLALNNAEIEPGTLGVLSFDLADLADDVGRVADFLARQ